MKNKQAVILICLCIAYALLRWAYMDYPAIDDAKRLSAALSLSADRGYVLPSYELTTNQIEEVNAATMWPPLTSHLYAICSHFLPHFYLSYLLLELLFGWILLLSLWYLMSAFKPKLKLSLMFLVVFNPIFIQKCISIDLYSTSIVLLGVALFRKSQEIERTSLWFILSLVCFSFGCYFRFNFYPISFAPFVALILLTWKKTTRFSNIQWALSLLVPVLFISVHLFWIQHLDASDAYITQMKKGFFIEHLLNIKAYNTTLLLGLDTGYLRILAANRGLTLLWQWSNMLLSLVELILTIGILLRVYRKPRGATDVLLSVLIVLTVAPLYALSFHIFLLPDWCFWTETRYFSLAALSTLLLLARYFSFSRGRVPVPYILAIFLTLWSLGIHAYRVKTDKYQWQNPAIELYTTMSEKAMYTDSNTVTFSNNHAYVTLLAQKGGKAFYYDVDVSLLRHLALLKQDQIKKIVVAHYEDGYDHTIRALVSEEKRTFDIHFEQR